MVVERTERKDEINFLSASALSNNAEIKKTRKESRNNTQKSWDNLISSLTLLLWGGWKHLRHVNRKIIYLRCLTVLSFRVCPQVRLSYVNFHQGNERCRYDHQQCGYGNIFMICWQNRHTHISQTWYNDYLIGAWGIS